MADSPETKERLRNLTRLGNIVIGIFHQINEGLEYAIDVKGYNQTMVIPTLRECQEEARRFIIRVDEFIEELP